MSEHYLIHAVWSVGAAGRLSRADHASIPPAATGADSYHAGSLIGHRPLDYCPAQAERDSAEPHLEQIIELMAAGVKAENGGAVANRRDVLRCTAPCVSKAKSANPPWYRLAGSTGVSAFQRGGAGCGVYRTGGIAESHWLTRV